MLHGKMKMLVMRETVTIRRMCKINFLEQFSYTILFIYFKDILKIVYCRFIVRIYYINLLLKEIVFIMSIFTYTKFLSNFLIIIIILLSVIFVDTIIRVI